MAEAAVDTPGSTAESGTPAKAHAPKDRSCPFCSQPFTSSSLGRHLDLYIKSKNPKPPDGIHDVNQIRQLRGNVTRRQARNSSSKREDSTPCSSRPPDRRSPSLRRSSVSGNPTRQVVSKLNEVSWQATGVINDIPMSSRDGSMHYDRRGDTSRRRSAKDRFGRSQHSSEDRDNGRAAELALREVLGSIKAASAQAEPPIFDFDFFSLNFPAMCLRCLSTPPSLFFSSRPIASYGSWSTELPGSTQHDYLRTWLETKIEARKQQKKATALQKRQRVGRLNGAMGDEVEVRHLQHLSNAFQSWESLSEKQKQELWRLEGLRSYSREQDKRKEAEARLRRVEQEAQHLRAQVDRLSKCQQPREFLLFPPATLPISSETINAASDLGGKEDDDFADWDYDRLLSKWRARIQSDRSTGAQTSLPPKASRNWDLSTSAPAHYGNGTASASEHPYPVEGLGQETENIDDAEHDDEDEGDGDLRDALGDEDISVEDSRAPQAQMIRGGAIDPNLKDHSKGGGGGGVMDGIEGSAGESFGNDGMIMGLREYAGLNGAI